MASLRRADGVPYCKLIERVSPVARGKSISAYHLNLTSYTVRRQLSAHLVFPTLIRVCVRTQNYRELRHVRIEAD